MYDLIIIGAGPAGMTAGVYAARKKMHTLILSQDIGGQPMVTREVENYMGYQYITGPELMTKFEEQVRQYPVEIKLLPVTGLKVTEGIFTVETLEQAFNARTVIIASGKRPRKLQVPGEDEYVGRGVSYCATCDGPLFAGKVVAVIGGGNSALQAALELSEVAEKVYLVVRRAFVADPVVVDKVMMDPVITRLMGYSVKEIQGGQLVEKIVLENLTNGATRELAVQGVFVEIGLVPNSDFAATVVKRNQRQEIIVDCRTNTGIPGLFAAGDVTNVPDKQIVVAAGEGAKAALAAYEYLVFK